MEAKQSSVKYCASHPDLYSLYSTVSEGLVVWVCSDGFAHWVLGKYQRIFDLRTGICILTPNFLGPKCPE